MRNTIFSFPGVCALFHCTFLFVFSFMRYNIWTCLSLLSHKSLILHSSQTRLTSSRYKGAKCFKKAIAPQRYWAFHALLDLLFLKLQGHLYLLTFLSEIIAFYQGKSD